jgi:hypothetical protein
MNSVSTGAHGGAGYTTPFNLFTNEADINIGDYKVEVTINQAVGASGVPAETAKGDAIIVNGVITGVNLTHVGANFSAAPTIAGSQIQVTLQQKFKWEQAPELGWLNVNEIPPGLNIYSSVTTPADPTQWTFTTSSSINFAIEQKGRVAGVAKGGTHSTESQKGLKLSVLVWLEPVREVEVKRLDACDFLRDLPQVDLIYLDPPYNQHPYGSNYFMLNLICTNERPHTLSKVSGIPGDWNKSQYNSKGKIREAMELTLKLATEKGKTYLGVIQ